MIKLQNLYFAGNISNAEYNRTLAGYNHELARIKDKRVALRNARVKLLKFSEIAGDLDRERKDIENRIKFMQKEFYVNKKMSKSQYDEEFSHANEILAEIEEEKATLDLINKHKSNKESSVKEKVRK